VVTIALVNPLDGQRRYGPMDVALYLLGVAGLSTCLTLVFLGMRAVMNVGGFCAEGGPYVIETHCPDGVPLVMIGGIFGLFLFGGLMGWKGSQLGGPWGALVLLAWPVLFISLGWNFLEYAIRPPAPEYGIVWGWLIPGVIFVVMGAVPLLAMLPSRAASRPTAADSPAALRAARSRLLNDLVRSAHDRGWGGTEDVVSKLERLAALHRAGSLDDAEFEQAKRAVLGGGDR